MNLTTVFLIIIGVIVLMGLVSHIQVSIVLRRWLEAVKYDAASGAEGQSVNPWVGRIKEEYQTYHLAGTSVNTEALIEKHLYREKVPFGIFRAPVGNCVKLMDHLPAFAIILGIMGTFIGLTFSMFSMQDTLVSLGQSEEAAGMSVNNIVAAITEPFKGMSLAFITSIAGIGSALLLNIIHSGFLSGGASVGYLIDKVFTETEDLLDHTFQEKLIHEKPKDSFEKILDRLANKVGESFQSTIGNFSREMVHFTEQLDEAMREVQQILTSQREHSDAFAQATEKMENVGGRFDESTKRFGDATQGINAQVKGLKEIVDRQMQRQESLDKRLEQHNRQTQTVIEGSNKKIEEVARQFLGASERQMQNFHDKYDHAASSLHRQQEDWLYQHQEMNNSYAQASDGFSQSVEQLERSLYQMFERVKRDIMEQMKMQQDRQSQMMNNDAARQDTRDLIRTVDNLSHAVDRQANDSQRYLQEFYQVLSRISQQLEQQSRDSVRYQQSIPTRVIDR